MRETLQPLDHSALKIKIKLVHFSPILTETIFLRAFFSMCIVLANYAVNWQKCSERCQIMSGQGCSENKLLSGAGDHQNR